MSHYFCLWPIPIFRPETPSAFLSNRATSTPVLSPLPVGGTPLPAAFPGFLSAEANPGRPLLFPGRLFPSPAPSCSVPFPSAREAHPTGSPARPFSREPARCFPFPLCACKASQAQRRTSCVFFFSLPLPSGPSALLNRLLPGFLSRVRDEHVQQPPVSPLDSLLSNPI